MAEILRKLRTLLIFIPIVSVSTIVCGTASLFLALVFRDGGPSHAVARLWARSILWTCGVRVDLTGLERLDRSRNYVFAANHQSLFDTPILFASLPFSFRILYKESLNAIPFLGWHLRLSGHIGVERSNAIRARRSLERAAERTRNGISVVVFPEGTRSRDGVMGRFKPGSFLLALKAAVPVVPITISESHRIMTRGNVVVHPGTIKVTVDSPIAVDVFREETVGDLSRAVREVVERNYVGPRPVSVSGVT